MENIALSEIMVTDLITVNPLETMDKVEDIFEQNNIHHLPVVNDNKELIGIISKSDYYLLLDRFTFLRKEMEEKKNDRFLSTLTARDVMTKQLAKLKPDDTILLALGFFRENRFHAIPIVDETNKLLGIVSTLDLINHAYKGLVV